MIDHHVIPHLWQSTQFAACIMIAAWGLRRNRASVRYWLWFSTSIKFLVPFAILTSFGHRVQPVAPPIPANLAAALQHASEPFSGEVSFAAAPAPIDWTPWIVAVWACGALVIATLRLRAWLRVRAMVRTSRRTDLPLSIEVRTTPGLAEPGIAGIWKPMLLLPEGICDHLTPLQFDAVVAHELCHVRRRDNLWSLLHMAVETIFWFHPLVWWIGGRLVEERERACDEAVLAEGKDPADYAEAIVNVCRRYVESPLACVSGVTGADLKLRIEAIFRQPYVLPLTDTRKLLLATAVLLPVAVQFLAGIATAQSRSFEVASVRQSSPPKSFADVNMSGGPGTNSPERFVYNGATIRSLLQLAYDLVDIEEQVSGPDWTRTQRYAIAATMQPGTTKEEFRQMLQNLLADRFGLIFHRETKELPIYELVIGRNGHKLRESRDTPVSDAQISFDKKTDRGFVDVPEGFTGQAMTTGVGPSGQVTQNWTYGRQSLPALSQILTTYAGRRVIDRTGLTGLYDFQLYFEPVRQGAGGAIPNAPTLSVFDAVEEQLGLRLIASRGDFDVIVIDHAEMEPTEN